MAIITNMPSLAGLTIDSETPDQKNTRLPPRASLLGLPAELRLIILEYALLPAWTHGKKIIHCCRESNPCLCCRRHAVALLRVSKQISREAMPIFHSSPEQQVTFTVRDRLKKHHAPTGHELSWNSAATDSDHLLINVDPWARDEHPLPDFNIIALDDRFASVKHIRIHCDVERMYYFGYQEYPDSTELDFGQVAELGRLPLLETLYLQVHILHGAFDARCYCYMMERDGVDRDGSESTVRKQVLDRAKDNGWTFDLEVDVRFEHSRIWGIKADKKAIRIAQDDRRRKFFPQL